jgi:hypothetical protein
VSSPADSCGAFVSAAAQDEDAASRHRVKTTRVFPNSRSPPKTEYRSVARFGPRRAKRQVAPAVLGVTGEKAIFHQLWTIPLPA